MHPHIGCFLQVMHISKGLGSSISVPNCDRLGLVATSSQGPGRDLVTLSLIPSLLLLGRLLLEDAMVENGTGADETISLIFNTS
jgi:hypothetical protein